MTLPILTIECLLGHFASIFLEAEFPLEAKFFSNFSLHSDIEKLFIAKKKNSGNFFAILTNAIIVIIGVVVVVIVVVDIVVVVVINVVVVVDSILCLVIKSLAKAEKHRLSLNTKMVIDLFL